MMGTDLVNERGNGACSARRTLHERLRRAGIAFITCNERGENIDVIEREEWLQRLLAGSPMAQRMVSDAVKAWSSKGEPEMQEPMPGVCVAGTPLIRRRRCVGYAVVIIPTERILESEHLAALCQSAQLDQTLTRSLLSELPLSREGDVGRLVLLARYLFEDQSRIMANDEAIESTGQQLAESYEEISLLYTIIQSMTVVQQPDRFVTITCNELLETLPYAWIGAQMVNDPEQLKRLSGRLIYVGDPRAREDELQELTEGLLGIARADAPLVLEPDRNPEHKQYQQFGGTILVHPITSDNRIIGLLIAGDKQGSDNVASSVDMKLLSATASNMSIFLENAALYDDLNAMFLGTLEALTASIDAKDRYTCGHSMRVAHLTQQLARAAGMDEEQVKRMHIAGLVHDVGKIGVPESVLLKPGKLTEDEFDWVRRHPEMGYRILKDIPQIKDILPGVLYHHERWDGRGYPEGLVAEEIPFIARLICLADSFDAMSSTRTYRRAMDRDQVLQEILNCSGTQFDPELAPIFVKLDFNEYDRLVNEHRVGKRLNPLLHEDERGAAA